MIIIEGVILKRGWDFEKEYLSLQSADHNSYSNFST